MVDKRRRRHRTYVASRINVDLCHTTSGQGRCSVKMAEFFDKCWGERMVIFEVLELGRVLKGYDNSLGKENNMVLEIGLMMRAGSVTAYRIDHVVQD